MAVSKLDTLFNSSTSYATIFLVDKKSGNSRYNIGGGWSSFGIVLIFGLILAAIGVGVGGGATIRIPFTELNLSIGGSLGKKEVVPLALPNYLQNRVADNSTFFNQSGTLTIWLAEGIGVIVLGRQPEAPPADLSVNLLR